jgi:V/A-type H+/Na+-transporting ATPase subunit D
MAALALSKSSLHQQRDRLQLFERFLPALELKRQQLTAEYHRAQDTLREDELAAARGTALLRALLPILGSASINLSGLVRVRRLEIVEESVLGVHLPALRAAEFQLAEYSLLATPFWMEAFVTCLKEEVTHRIRLQVYRERVARLRSAVRRITQRVNLFEKVLIPEARRNISRLQIFLSDMERSAVVISKISKAKRMREAAAAAALAGGRS